MHLSETVNLGFLFLAPWLVFAPVVGLLINFNVALLKEGIKRYVI
jgi:hypothetical protein